MKKILSILLAAAALNAGADNIVIPSTPFTRPLMRSTNANQFDMQLGLAAGTNASNLIPGATFNDQNPIQPFVTNTANQAILDSPNSLQPFVTNTVNQAILDSPNSLQPFTTNAASAATLPTNNIAVQYGFSTNILDSLMQSLPHYRMALARAKAHLGECRIAFIGDSTTAGFGADFQGYTNATFYSYPVQFAAYFNNGSAGSIIGSHLNYTSPLTTIPLMDPRVFMGDWIVSAYDSLGGELFESQGIQTNPFVFSPTEQCNYAQIWYVNAPGNGDFGVIVDGVLKQVIHENTALTLTSMTFNFATGTHVIKLWQTNVTSVPVFVLGIVTGNSTNGVELLNCGFDASTTAKWIESGTPYAPISAVATFSPDLYVINLGINDIRQPFSVAMYSNNIVTILAAAKSANTDVVLIVPTPIQGYSFTSFGYQTALYNIGNTFGIPVVSMNRFFFNENWGAMNGAGMSYDSLHPNGYGYQNEADYLASLLAGKFLNR